MTVKLIDEAWAKASPNVAKAFGYSGIIGYISEDNTGKNLTRAQVDAIHAAHLDVGFADEYGATEARGGSTAGHARALKSVAFARALGVPSGVAFYAPADWDVTDAEKPAVLAYAQAHDVILRANGYRGGLYSGYWTIKYLAEHGYQGFLWQTYGWSGGLWYPGVTIRQERNGIIVGGADVDMDEAMVPDWGQWSADTNAIQGVEVAFDDIDKERLRQVWSVVGSAYAASQAAGENPVRDIGGQVWDLGTAIKAVRAKLDTLPTGGGALTDTDRQAITDLTAALNAVAAHLK